MQPNCPLYLKQRKRYHAQASLEHSTQKLRKNYKKKRIFSTGNFFIVLILAKSFCKSGISFFIKIILHTINAVTLIL